MDVWAFVIVARLSIENFSEAREHNDKEIQFLFIPLLAIALNPVFENVAIVEHS